MEDRDETMKPNHPPNPRFLCDMRATFAAAFHACRIKHNIPLRQIAGDLKLSIATINSWESGERFPTGAHFEQIANYTGVPPCKLFCRMADQCVRAQCLLAQG